MTKSARTAPQGRIWNERAVAFRPSPSQAAHSCPSFQCRLASLASWRLLLPDPAARRTILCHNEQQMVCRKCDLLRDAIYCTYTTCDLQFCPPPQRCKKATFVSEVSCYCDASSVSASNCETMPNSSAASQKQRHFRPIWHGGRPGSCQPEVISRLLSRTRKRRFAERSQGLGWGARGPGLARVADSAERSHG